MGGQGEYTLGGGDTSQWGDRVSTHSVGGHITVGGHGEYTLGGGDTSQWGDRVSTCSVGGGTHHSGGTR